MSIMKSKYKEEIIETFKIENIDIKVFFEIQTGSKKRFESLVKSVSKSLDQAEQRTIDKVVKLIKKEIKSENATGAYNRNFHRVKMCEEIIEKLKNHDKK